MDNYSKYEFSGINFKKRIASRFRDFSMRISKSNTESLEAMLDFFKIHQLSPFDSIEGGDCYRN